MPRNCERVCVCVCRSRNRQVLNKWSSLGEMSINLRDQMCIVQRT